MSLYVKTFILENWTFSMSALNITHSKGELKNQNSDISILKPAIPQFFSFLSFLYAFVTQAIVYHNLLSLGMC